MAKGVLYIMTTIVEGLIKIGKTQTVQFENRMTHLERNGYRNVTGLKRKFAIKVDEYDEKESMLHKIFDRSRVPNTELFALDVNQAVLLLSSLEGKQIYPKPTEMSKKEVFSDATEVVAESLIHNGTYYLKRRVKDNGNKEINATMRIENGKYIVLSGSDFCPVEVDSLSKALSDRRKKAKIKNNVLTKDEEFNSASTAAVFILGYHENGLKRWKNKDGISLKELLYTDESE